jgi:hypothetical protein
MALTGHAFSQPRSTYIELRTDRLKAVYLRVRIQIQSEADI